MQGILSYFHIENQLSSPTFTIVNEYQTPLFPIYHFDVYRLQSSDEFYAIGGDQYFDHGLCFVEWGELIKDVLPPSYLQLSFSRDPEIELRRTITFSPNGKEYISMIKEILL